MDKLTNRLKADAAAIEVQVSDEFDRRLGASLQGIEPMKPRPPEATGRPAIFWWASSLSGVAAALVIIAIVNSLSQPEEAPLSVAEMSPVNVPATPVIDWKTESAMLTQPLQRELEDLRSDLKKAEEKVKQDIGL